jgi:hypothetical protein
MISGAQCLSLALFLASRLRGWVWQQQRQSGASYKGIIPNPLLTAIYLKAIYEQRGLELSTI